MVDLEITRHARERTTARAIPPLIVEMIVEFGDSCDAGDGARKYALSKEGMRRLRRYAGHAVADEANRFRSRNAYVVAAHGRVVTAAFSSKPIIR
ncbi:hypothetical protein [Niveispirillum cyanobacteriorum]|uniref:Uncharacterized protein n=1 Tax=Niveispirillum cyanobacteriorum TaxID=1612173 RepID=A0A2K9N922_9PROT|nr:hypothetical protein [Niveispirillum cyanobacteriorum]AUN29640.1 hypothetical protein C0V82_04925 [Niveispirillum cyanobacteriorum]GGE62413.1 hypothetical protein GCM10011317_19880 [Niveispirillum cyanobacteriorum]